jgi:hypothetical protein
LGAGSQLAGMPGGTEVATMNTAVFGIFPSAWQAESAMASLALARFAYGDVSVIMLNGDGSTATAHAGRTRQSGAKTAVATSPAIGGTLGLLSGRDVACRRMRPWSPVR